MSTQFELKQTLKYHPLTCLNQAIDEAKLIRSIIKSKKLIETLKETHPYSDRLNNLDHEIEFLDQKLALIDSVQS